MTSTRSIFLILLTLSLQLGCNTGGKEYTVNGEVIMVDSVNAPQIDLELEAKIQQYRKALKEDMDRILVYSEEVMEKGSPEGKLSNFVADLVFEKGKELYKPADGKQIDFCLLNNGGLRVPLPKGEITFSRVFELMPFENEMVVLTLSGEKTLQLFQHIANSKSGMPVSGVRLTVEKKTPVSILIGGNEFDIDRNYKVLTSDYLADGGDNMEFFQQPINYELLGMKIRDAIIEHMQQVHARGEMISARLDQRIHIIN